MRLIIVLVLGAILLFIPNLLYKKNWHKGVNVELYFEKDVMREGEDNVMVEVISNDKLLPLPVIEAKFSITRSFVFPKEVNSSVTDNYYRCEYFSCKPYQKITRKYKFKAVKRGDYKISSLDVLCKDLLMDKNLYAQHLSDSHVTVLPARLPADEIPKDLVIMNGDVVKRYKLFDDPFEFKSIREYAPYDSMNHINWKASAKNDGLYVNTFNDTNRKKVVILLNLDMNSMYNFDLIFEMSIKLAAYLVDYFVSSEVPVAFYTNGKDFETNESPSYDSGCNDGHVRGIEMSLARIDIKKKTRKFVKIMDKNIDKDSTDEYIIISNYRKNDFLTKYNEFKEDGVRINLIVPELVNNDISPVVPSSTEIKWEIQHER